MKGQAPQNGGRPISTSDPLSESVPSLLVNKIALPRRLVQSRGYVNHSVVFVLAAVLLAMSLGAVVPGRVDLVAPVREVGQGYMTAAGPVGGGDASLATLPDEPTAASTTASPTASPAPAAFTTHEVVEGETLAGIAETYGVGIEYLIWNNPGVYDPDSLIIGEKLLVPSMNGIVYNVRLGDTVNDISATYGVDPAAVISYAPNELESPDLITEGMVLVLPGGVPPPPPPPPEPEPAPAPAPDPVTPAPEPAPEPVVPSLPAVVAAPDPTAPPAVPAAAAAAPPPGPAPSAGYMWPVAGPLNSRFGNRWGGYHEGIDIGARSGTAVAAAASGQVVLAVYGDYGYGNYIIVRHGDGSETLYAHLSAIYVGLGQGVGQGAGIGAVGCSGWCTGPHLHFEVHIGGRAVDPLGYLP
jgi:murein DD-endopeptidase MepM/ murein hydrolase activator NlpD